MKIEDGSGVQDANSYASETMFEKYTEDRGYTIAPGDVEAALVRGTQWLDNTYRSAYQGVRTHGRNQGLEWPRKAGTYILGVFVNPTYMTTVTDAEGVPIATNEIPTELIQATCEAAFRELSSPGSLAPDLDRGGAIKAVKAGSVSVEYFGSASAMTTFTAIDNIMSNLIPEFNAGFEQYTARAVRA